MHKRIICKFPLCLVPSFLSKPCFTLKLIPQNKWRGDLGNPPGWIFFVVGQRQRKECAQLDGVTIDLLWHFCTNHILKWQSSIRRFSHTNHICMSKKIKYPFIYLFIFQGGFVMFEPTIKKLILELLKKILIESFIKYIYLKFREIKGVHFRLLFKSASNPKKNWSL